MFFKQIVKLEIVGVRERLVLLHVHVQNQRQKAFVVSVDNVLVLSKNYFVDLMGQTGMKFLPKQVKLIVIQPSAVNLLQPAKHVTLLRVDVQII